MIATRDTLEAIVRNDDTIQPDCGAVEASMESFMDWYAAVKDADTGDGTPVRAFDCGSVLAMFDEDLREFSKETKHEETAQ